ncbi:MAG: SCO family protein [Melioribacteraceae bacterium]|nr:SCO family protein [Melioribacteraceae bacterium]
MLISEINFAQEPKIGVVEKLGVKIPLELNFTNSNGELIQLKDIINKPTLLALVYYECPGICSPLQNELAWLIDKIQLEIGKDYQVISLSIDHHEDSKVSNKWKVNYLKSIKKKLNENDWMFLTGDSLSIQKLTKTVGYYFEPYEKQFSHAGTLISISPDGKVCRYLFGTQFNPFDVKMALIEAKAGKTNPTISKVLEYCFSYDPKGRQYTLNVTRIVGTIMLVGVGIFAFFVVYRKNKNKNEGVELDG